jgi:histone H3/H4
MADMIISKSKTKEAVTECNVSGEFYVALDAKVRELIKAAEKRAIDNGRKTVRPYDL